VYRKRNIRRRRAAVHAPLVRRARASIRKPAPSRPLPAPTAFTLDARRNRRLAGCARRSSDHAARSIATRT